MNSIIFKVGGELSNTIVELSTTSDTCRTPKQVEAFINHYVGSDIVYFCNNPFKIDYPHEKYRSTFAVAAYNTDGRMVCFDITPAGIIKNYTVLDYPDMTKYGMKNRTPNQYKRKMMAAIKMNVRFNVTNFTELPSPIRYVKDQSLLFTRDHDVNIPCWYNRYDSKSGKHVVRFSIGDRDDNEKVTDNEIRDIHDVMTGFIRADGVEYDTIVDILAIHHIEPIWTDGMFYIPTDHITPDLMDDLSGVGKKQ